MVSIFALYDLMHGVPRDSIGLANAGRGYTYPSPMKDLVLNGWVEYDVVSALLAGWLLAYRRKHKMCL